MNSQMYKFGLWTVLPIFVAMTFASNLQGQENPNLDKIKAAFKLQPKQEGIDYDTPEVADMAKCRIARSIETFGVPGWILYDNTGRLVRILLDRDKNGDLDQWTYYKNGIEVYRDIDSDFDGKTDQYRWMGTSGRRWGLDKNQDGEVDSWQAISAEEVSEEVFLAFKTRDRKRFLRLLLKGDELKQLGLGERMSAVVTESVNEAGSQFDKIVAAQKLIGRDSKFVDFGGSRPSLVPEGREGITQDLVVYDHAQSLFSSGNNQYGQISIGTIVEVDDVWRILEVPEMMSRSKPITNGGLFFPMPTMGALVGGGDNTGSPVNAKLGKMFDEYEELEKQLRSAKASAATTKLQVQRAELLSKMIEEQKRDEDKKNWIRQMADTVSSAYQRDLYPDGLEFLEDYLKTRKAAKDNFGLDYVEYRTIQARSHAGMQGSSRDRADANQVYMEDLEDYVGLYAEGEFAADALMQLALFNEVSDARDAEEQASRWYSQVVENFPESPHSGKAAGAVARLGSIGNTITFRAPTLSGKQTFDLRAYRGKRIVVIHYWATWCDACVEDFEELKRLKAKYKDEVSIIGCNVDDDADEVKSFLAGKGVTWPQLWDEGGLESSVLAEQLGVTALPLTLLVDKNGEVAENQISVNDLDRDIQRAIRRAKNEADASSGAGNTQRNR